MTEKKICPHCKQEYEGKACLNSYGCVYATTSVSEIDKENGIHTNSGGLISSVESRALED